jgi:protein-tyrosine phosphatase
LIVLEGAVNFRDLGGYEDASGEWRTRWRVLFRADGLGDLTEPDFEVIRAIGIRTVVDLRAPYELERGVYDVSSHPVAFHHIPFIESIPDPEEFDRRPDLLEAQYLEMLDGAGAQICDALTVLAGTDALPAVFHCTAGKDRTGLLSAVLLSLLGIPEETVVADYALSADAMDRLKEKIIRKYPDAADTINSIDGVFSAHPTKMETLLAYLRDNYGSVHDYADGIGVGADVVQGLRAKLLEPTA